MSEFVTNQRGERGGVAVRPLAILFSYVTTLADCACAFELFHDARRTNDVNARRLYKAPRAETRFRLELLLSENKVDFARHRHFDV